MQPAASWARGYFGAWALSLRLRQPIIGISKANQQPFGRKYSWPYDSDPGYFTMFAVSTPTLTASAINAKTPPDPPAAGASGAQPIAWL